MNREDELFARVIAQQRQITALHTVLDKVLKHCGESLGEDTCVEIRAALETSEPTGRAEFELAIAQAAGSRMKHLRAELATVHAQELAAKDAEIAGLTRRDVPAFLKADVPDRKGN